VSPWLGRIHHTWRPRFPLILRGRQVGGRCWSTSPICGCTLRCREVYRCIGGCYFTESTAEQLLHKSSLLPARGGRFEGDFDGCACEVRIQLSTAGFLIELWEVFYLFAIVINPAILFNKRQSAYDHLVS
jgi:hypothetical protein